MNAKQDPGSHLFLVRFWAEGAKKAKDGQEAQEGREAHNARDHKEWSGRVQHILTGEARTFHDWHTLIEMLLEMAETDGIEGRAQRPKIQEVTR